MTTTKNNWPNGLADWQTRQFQKPNSLADFDNRMRFLSLLAEETQCETDPDLMFNGSSSEMVFIGRARKCWVKYIDSATVILTFVKWEKSVKIHLEDPRSLERMEKIFHDEDGITFDNVQ